MLIVLYPILNIWYRRNIVFYMIFLVSKANYASEFLGNVGCIFQRNYEHNEDNYILVRYLTIKY